MKIYNPLRTLEAGNLIFFRAEKQKYKHSTIPDLCF